MSVTGISDTNSNFTGAVRLVLCCFRLTWILFAILEQVTAECGYDRNVLLNSLLTSNYQIPNLPRRNDVITRSDADRLILALRRCLASPENNVNRGVNVQVHPVTCDTREDLHPRDCAEVQESGRNVSGRYAIFPDECADPFFVYCDMETDRGGWTVLQRRTNGGEDFDRDWAEYKYGFGSVSGEHWLGNERTYRIARQKLYQLRIDMEDFDGGRRYAMYRTFRLSNGDLDYVLKIGRYSGNAGNGLLMHSGRPFSTRDRDNDLHKGNCAQTYMGGWWYHRCHTALLNGLYLGGAHDDALHGVNWPPWKGQRYSLKFTEMKLRPLSARVRFGG